MEKKMDTAISGKLGTLKKVVVWGIDSAIDR